MNYLKVIARSLANAIGLTLGLWGVAVNNEFFWLFAALCVLGGLNLAMGLWDERNLRLARTEAQEDRTVLRDLQRHVLKLVGPKEIPPHLQNLADLSDTELKSLVGSVSARLRQYAGESGERHISPSWWETHANWDGLSEAEKREHWNEHQRLEREASELRLKGFLEGLRPDSLALWNELRRRVTDKRGDNVIMRPVAIEYGMLAGAYPIEEAATALEGLARYLKD